MNVPSHLTAQLDRCTVQVHGEDGFVGSGVFVTPDVVLTCAHVVLKAESECRIIWRGQPYAVIDGPDLFPPPEHDVFDSYPFPDLAVLRLAEPFGHPCARLGTEEPPIGSRVYASGFSRQTLTSGTALDGLLVEVAAHSGELLRVKHDQIYRGLSGSPVLDVASDRVCGLVKATRDEFDERGGWIIPATAFPRYLPSLVEENRTYHEAGPPWDQVLSPPSLRKLFEAQRKAAEAMPYQLTGAPRVNLANVYVRQQLGQRAEDRDEGGARDEGGDRDLRKFARWFPKVVPGSASDIRW
ncbi:MAG: serine protease [Streptosporangiaceae bacterium]